MDINTLSNTSDFEKTENTTQTITGSFLVAESEFTFKKFLQDTTKIAIPGILFYASIVMLQFTNILFIGNKYDNKDSFFKKPETSIAEKKWFDY